MLALTASPSLEPRLVQHPPKPAMTPTVLAYRLRCLTDELTRLAHAVPERHAETCSELLRARDAIWFAAKRIKPANPQPKGTP